MACGICGLRWRGLLWAGCLAAAGQCGSRRRRLLFALAGLTAETARGARRCQAEQENAQGFAEEPVDGLGELLLDFAAERGEPTFEADDGVEHGVEREGWVEVAAQRAVGDALTDEPGEEVEVAQAAAGLDGEEFFDRPVAGVERVKLSHEAGILGVAGEFFGEEIEERGDAVERASGAVHALLDEAMVVGEEFADEGGDDLVLVGEVLVERGGLQAAGGGDLGDGDAVDAVGVKERAGGVEDASALTLAVSAVGGDGIG